MRRAAIFGILLVCVSIGFAGEIWPSRQDALSALVKITKTNINKVQQGIESLCQKDEIRSMDWEKAHLPLAEFEEDWFLTFLVHPDGSYYTPLAGLTDKNLKSRDYFPGLMAGDCFTGFFHISKSTGRRAMMLGCPVMDGEKVVGGIGASIFLDAFGDMIGEGMGLDSNSVFFVINTDSMTVISSDNTDDFTYSMDMGSESLRMATMEILAGGSGETSYTYDGRERQVAYTHDPETGWYFVYGDIVE